MVRRRRHATGSLVFLVASVLLLAFSQVSSTQAFGEPGGFGDAEPSRTFETVQPSDSSEQGYFIHDQLLKVVVFGFRQT